MLFSGVCYLQQKMLKNLFLISCLLALTFAKSAPKQAANERPAAGSTTYDQRQTGKYNVHVNIKDVQFFSLSDSLASIGGDYPEYGEYDVLGGFGDTDTDYDTGKTCGIKFTEGNPQLYLFL